jgi:predicted DCC family thiol-disulfide oxidoreductase YuxK
MPHLILFDGVCNFCNASINFVIDHDHTKRFRFASLQSDYGQSVLRQYNKNSTDFDTVLLVSDGQLYEKSAAALEIARYLDGYAWLYGFRFIPTFIRNFVYDIVARYRYRIFGKSETCRIPTEAEKGLFITK